MKTVLTIWWWTWTFNLVSWIRTIPDIFINTLVSMSDDWWSTWTLRDEYWILPPWDTRRAIIALSDTEKASFLRELFAYRYENWILKWQNLWNLIMLASEKITQNYWSALNELENLFDIQNWKVYPATFDSTKLIAKLENDQYIIWETNIDKPKHDVNQKIKNFRVIREKYAKILKTLQEVWSKDIFEQVLSQAKLDRPSSNESLSKIINNLDYIIFCPWDLYTSILPNLLVWDNLELIKNSPAKKIYVANIFTKFWETNDYNLSDFVWLISTYFQKDIFDYILVQDASNLNIDPRFIEKYHEEWKTLVENNMKNDKRVIVRDLIAQWPFVRHDQLKLKNSLKEIIYS